MPVEPEEATVEAAAAASFNQTVAPKIGKTWDELPSSHPTKRSFKETIRVALAAGLPKVGQPQTVNDVVRIAGDQVGELLSEASACTDPYEKALLLQEAQLVQRRALLHVSLMTW